jgi:integrase/recombinase XerC
MKRLFCGRIEHTVMINEFLQYLQYEKNYSFHTVLSYNTDLLQFCSFLDLPPDQFDPAGVDKQKIQAWVLLLMSEKLSPAVCRGSYLPSSHSGNS